MPQASNPAPQTLAPGTPRNSAHLHRYQVEVARTYCALTQSQFLEKAAEQQAMTDVKSAYETLLNSQEIVQLYNGGYLQQAQQSLDIAQFSYQHGAAMARRN